MTKKRGDDTQFKLDLGTKSAPKTVVGHTPNVVPFVDAATLKVRREAVSRVVQAGIFSLPPNLRGR